MNLSRSRRVPLAAICAATVAVLGTANAASASDRDPTLVTSDGAVRGLDVPGGYAFRGLPYAASPTGDLRWRAPKPAAPWQGVKKAAEFGANCMQTIVQERKHPTRKLPELFKTWPTSRVVMEASAEAFRIADAALAAGHEVRVVPGKLVRLLGVGDRGVKNDQQDARHLSKASWQTDVPSVHIRRRRRARSSRSAARATCSSRRGATCPTTSGAGCGPSCGSPPAARW